jgi:hypothetical protein
MVTNWWEQVDSYRVQTYTKIRHANHSQFIFSPPNITSHPSPCLLWLSVMIDLVIPKQRLIPIAPPKRLGPDILIGKLDFILGERAVDFVIVVLAVQFVGVEDGDDDGGEGDVESYLSPEVSKSVHHQPDSCNDNLGRRWESIRKGVGRGRGECTSGVTCVDLGSLTVEGKLGCVLDATDLLTKDRRAGGRGDDSGEQGA